MQSSQLSAIYFSSRDVHTSFYQCPFMPIMDLPSNHTVLSSGLSYYCSGIDLLQSCCETPPLQQEDLEGATQRCLPCAQCPGLQSSGCGAGTTELEIKTKSIRTACSENLHVVVTKYHKLALHQKAILSRLCRFAAPVLRLRKDLLGCGSDFLSASALFCGLYAPVYCSIPCWAIIYPQS